MSFPYQHLVSRLVLLSFFFQTLWPSVVFAATEVEIPRASVSSPSFTSPPSSSLLNRPRIAVAPFTLQAFVDDQVEGFDNIGSKPVVSFPGAASLAEAQEWFEGSLEAQSLYPDLVVTEEGLLWSQYGLNFLMGLSGHLFVSSVPSVEATTKTLRLHNYHGDVVFGGKFSLSHVQVQARNILQASSNALVERLEIWAMGHESPDGKEEAVEGRFTNREGASLTTTQVTVHEGNLENLGTWKVSDQGVVDLQGHDFINEETLTLGDKAAVKNQGTFGNTGIVKGDSYTLEMAKGENAGVISGDAPRIIVSETLSNQQGAKILGKDSLTVSGKGTIDNQGTVAGEKALALENKTFINHNVVHSGGAMRLALQEKMTNVGTGRVTALGQAIVEGKSTIQNDASLQENAGFAFAGGVHFNNFQGEVINAGLMTSQTTMTGSLRKLINTGTFGASRGYQGLTILDFLNDATGKFLGDGHLILNGRNRGLMQADRLLLQIDGEFTHEATGLLQIKTDLDTRGEGKFFQRGQVHTPLFTVNTTHFESFGSLGDNAMEVVVGRFVRNWKNHEKSHFKAKRLTLERGQGSAASALDAFVNEGTLEIGTFINRRSGFTNRGQMTLGHWHQLGLSFKNALGGEIDVSESSEVDTDTIDNEGDINWEGPLKGRLRQFLNQGGVKIQDDAHLAGTRLVNKKIFKALSVFDWVGETVENDGRMVLFDNRVIAARQIINKGLLLWTHNVLKAAHFLNLGWAEAIPQLDTSMPTWKISKDKSTTFREETIENRGILKLVRRNYTDDFTFRWVEHFMHWLNTGVMVLPATHLNAQTFKNDSSVTIVEGGITGQVVHFENTQKLMMAERCDLTGKTFENSGVLKLKKGGTYKGETIITTDESEIISKEHLALTSTDPLDIRGKLHSDKGITVEAPGINNHGNLIVRTGKAVLEGELWNYRQFDVDELVYEGDRLENFGKLEANTYHRATPLKILSNALKKTVFIVRKGEFSVQQMTNRGKLELSNGVYRFEGWDNKNGTADIDQLCLAFLNPLLEGKLDANVLIPFDKTFESLTIAGETVFRKGNLATKKLTARNILTLAEGDYAVGYLDNEAKAEIRLLPKTQLEVKDWIDNQGEIISDTGLEIMSRKETPSSLVTRSVTTPRLLLDSFWGYKASFYSIRRLGALNIIESISLLFGTERHIEYFLGENLSKWAIGQKVLLTGDLFENDWRTLNFPWPTEALVKRFYQKSGTLKAKGLKLDAETFKLGEDNNAMGALEVYGSLDLTVKNDVDWRYGIVKAQGRSKVVSMQGNILLGDCVDEPRTVTLKSWVGPVFKYTFHRRNGARFSGGGETTFESKKGKLLFTYGSVYSKGILRLTAPDEILNLASAIWADNYIDVTTPFYSQKASVVEASKGQLWEPNQCQWYHLLVKNFTSDAPELHSLIAIFLKAPKVENIGGTILAVNRLLNESYDEDISFIKNHAQLHEVNWHNDMHAGLGMSNYCYNAVLETRGGIARGGQSISFKTDLLELTGTLTAPKLKVDVSKLLAKNFGGKRGDIPQIDIVIDLCELARAGAKYLPMIQDALSQGKGINLDVLGHESTPSMQESAALVQRTGTSTIPGSLGGFNPLPPLAMSDDLLQYTMLFALSDYLGTLNVYGLSGKQLLARLFKTGKATEKKLKKEGQLITKDSLQSSHEGMIYHEIMRIAGHLYRVPKLLVTPDMIDPHGNESGAMSGVDVDVKVRDGIDGEGNGIYAQAVRRAPSQLAEKKTTERRSESAGVEDEEAEEGESSPALQLEPKLKVTVENGNINLTDGLIQNRDGKVTVKTEKSGDINLTATKVSGKDEVMIDSADGVSMASTASRIGRGENFVDHQHQASAESTDGSLNIRARKKSILFQATKTYSKLGTSIEAAEHIVDKTLALMSQTVTRDGKNWTRDTYTYQSRSEHVSDTSVTSVAQGVQDLTAPKIKAPEVLVFGGQGVVAHEAHNIHEHASHRESKGSGWFSRSKRSDFQSTSASSVGIEVEAKKAHFISGGDLVLTNPRFTVDETTLTSFEGVVKLLQGTNYYSSQFSGKSADAFWQTMTQRVVQSKTHSAPVFTGELTIEAREAIVQQVCGQTLAFLNKLDLKGGKLTLEFVHDLYDVKEQRVSGPTAALSVVISLAASIAAVATGGAAWAGSAAVSATGATGMSATVISAMGYAGFSALCAQTTMALVNNKLNIGRAAQDLVKKDSLKALVKAMAAAGLVAGASQFLGTPASVTDASTRATADAAQVAQDAGLTVPTAGHLFDASLAQHAAFQAVNMGATLAVDAALGESLEKAFGSGALGFAAGLVGGVGSNQIGAVYAQNVLDVVSHKLLHAGLGAATGAIMGGERGAVAGAMGAFVAETFADAFSPEKPMEKVRKLEAEKGRKLTSAEFTAYYDQEMKAYQPKVGRVEDWARITAATTALLAGQDVTVAAMAATNAVQNNFALLAYYGVVAASLAYSTYEVYNAYEEGGAVAALKQLGIEVVTDVVGAGALRAGGKVVYKIGSAAYPTVEAALTAVLNKTPSLRMALGKLVDKLSLAGDAIAQSALGRGVATAEAALGKMEAKVGERLGLGGRKAERQGFVQDIDNATKIGRVDKLAQEVSEISGGILKSTTGDGYKILIPNGSDNIVVRIMKKGGQRSEPYFKVSIPGKKTLSKDGIVTSDPALTHIDIGSSTAEEIMKLVDKLKM